MDVITTALRAFIDNKLGCMYSSTAVLVLPQIKGTMTLPYLYHRLHLSS